MATTVRIYRGVAGAGKSTLIRQWLEQDKLDRTKARVFSADHYRLDPVTRAYVFDAKNPGLAHAKCFFDYLRCLARNSASGDYYSPDWIIIDNTNCRAYEIAPYVQAANAYGLSHEIVTVLCDPAVAAARNVHGVPAATIWAMHQAILTEHLPPFWNHAQILSGGQP